MLKKYQRAVVLAFIATIITAHFLCVNLSKVYAAKCKSHSYGSWITTAEASCKSTGTKVRTCRKCGASDVATIPKTGHSYTVTSSKDGTCVSKGTQTKKCSRCGETVTSSTGYGSHSYGAYKTSIAPTCSSTGSSAATCKYCKDVVTKTIAKDPNNHSNPKTTTKNATCTENGYTETKCNACNRSISKTTIKATGHSMSGWTTTKKPDCEHSGEDTNSCQNKGCSYSKTRSTDPLGHNFILTGTTPGTCVSRSSVIETCLRCKSTNTTYGNYGTHSFSNYEITREGTCIEHGKMKGKCIFCSATDEIDTGIVENNHVGISQSYSRMVDNGVYHIFYYQCTGCKKEIFQKTQPCDCHYHSMYSYYGGHTPQGHMKYYACYAGDYSYSSGHYEKDPSCPSCTNAPGVKIISIQNGEIFASGEIKVRVNLTDNENDKLTLKLFLDDAVTPIETKQADATRTGADFEFLQDINIGNLSEGVHKIKVTADDPISPAGRTEVSFLIDKSAPVISSVDIARSETGFSFVVDASDDISEVSAYRFTIDGVSRDFDSSAVYNLEGLSPDTEHSYKLEVKNGAGLIAEREGIVYTCAHVPEIKPVMRSGRLTIKMDNTNPTDTLYEVMVGDSFVNTEGSAYILSDTSESLSDIEKINIGNLEADTVYDIKVTVLGKDGLRYESETAGIRTGKKSSLDSELAVPVVSGSSVSTTTAFVSWSAIEGAVSYELEIDGNVYNLGNVCEHTVIGLSAGTSHEYRVRARNSYSKSRFSDSLVITQGDVAPSIPEITKITGQGDFAKIMWDTVPGADHYELEINGELFTKIKATAFVYHSASDTAIVAETEGENEELLSLETYTGENLNVRVRAVNSYGVSSFSESASIESGTAAERLVSESLDAPEVNVTNAGLTMIRLNWPNIIGASFYEIYVNGEKYAETADNSVNIEDLIPDSEYVVMVRAIDENVSSESSLTVRTKSAGTATYTDRTVSGLSNVSINATAGSYYRLRLPLSNVADESRYSVTISLDADKAELIDMVAATKERELTSEDGKFTFGNRNYFVYYKDEKMYITIVCEIQYASKLYNAADILIKALTDGEIVFEVNR